MNDLKKKLVFLHDTKEQIREAIADRQVSIPAETPLREYPNKIRQIPLGGAAALNIAYGDTAPEDTGKLWVKGDAPLHVIMAPGTEPVREWTEAGYDSLCDYVRETLAVTIGRKIYVVFGKVGVTDEDYFYYALVYDVDTGKSEKIAISTSYLRRCDHALEVINGKIYVVGGKNGNKERTVLVLDIDTMKAKNHGELTLYSSQMSSAAVGDKIYLFGGLRSSDSWSNVNPSNLISVYDVSAASETILGIKLPFGMYGMSAVAVGEKIYLFGGRSYVNNVSTIGATIMVFNTAENDYSQMLRVLDVKLPTASSGMGRAHRIGKYIYYFYGMQVWRFDPETEEIVNLGNILPVSDGTRVIAVVDNCAYILGGYVEYKNMKTVHKFTVETGLGQDTMMLMTSPAGCQMDIVNMGGLQMRTGITGVYRGDEKGIAQKQEAYLWGIRELLRGYTSAWQTSSGTELTGQVQSEPGQLVIAAIAARDTFTLSAGWTLISESKVNSTDTEGQRLAFAYKYAESDLESVTVTQASEKRMYINLVSLRGATGFTHHGFTYKDTTDSAVVTATKPAGLTLWACSASLWGTSLPYPQWEADDDHYRIDLGNDTQSRLAIFMDHSEAEQVTFTAGATGPLIVGCLSIEGMDKFYEGDGSGWVEI